MRARAAAGNVLDVETHRTDVSVGEYFIYK
jgi:hypothetical protein